MLFKTTSNPVLYQLCIALCLGVTRLHKPIKSVLQRHLKREQFEFGLFNSKNRGELKSIIPVEYS